MKSRATRNRRLRSCAWAFLAALLPATEGRADGELASPASPANVATDAAPAVASRPKKPSSRPKIPPPRKFVAETESEIPQTDLAPVGMENAVLQANSEPAAAPNPLSAGDPSRVAAAAALLGASLDSAPTHEPAASNRVEQPPADLTPAEQPALIERPASTTVPSEPPISVERPAPLADAAPAPAPVQTPATEYASMAASDPITTAPSPFSTALTSAKSDPTVAKAGCSTCGGFHSTLDGPAFHQSFEGPGQCVPGRKGACAVPANDCDTLIGGFVANLWQCLCCPDPCYQPTWVPAANASLFVDYARPRTVTRLRFDRLMDMTHPDRNQYFLKQINPNGTVNVTRDRFPNRRFTGRFLMDPSLNMSQLYLYQEAATERASFFVEIPYRQINPIASPTQAGFADMNLGSKALLFDCEMLQVTFQFRTFLPTGNAQVGLGTAHVSLDPSLLATLKLAPDTYFQAQVGNWIPLGGTSNIAGGMAYWLMSLNQVLAYITPDSPLIGTLEMDGYTFQNGGWTRSFIGTGSNARDFNSQSGDSYFNIGPGLRQSICNKVDIGGAITWATTLNHWADPWFRLEMRFLF